TRQTIPSQIASLHLFSVERHVDSSEALIELLRPAGPDNGGGDARLGQDPGDGDLNDRLAAWLEKMAQMLDRFELRLMPIAFSIQLAGEAQRKTSPRRRCLLRAIACGKEATS